MNKFLKSFTYAFKGLVFAFKTQLNFKVHCFAAVAVILLGVYVDLNKVEWLWIALAIAMVLVVELINTAIEVLVDLLSPQRQIKAGIIKDVAAAAVLVTAGLALTIGLFVFLPRIL